MASYKQKQAAKRAARKRRRNRETVSFLIGLFVVLGVVGAVFGLHSSKDSTGLKQTVRTDVDFMQHIKVTPEPFYIYYDRDNGDAVSELQKRLWELGYYTEDFSGQYDEATAQAVRDFELVHGLPETGIADDALLQKIFSKDAIRNEKVYINLNESIYHTLECSQLNTAFRIRPLAEAIRVGCYAHDCVKDAR